MTFILLITIDCLRADHMGCYGYPKPTTPNIDRIAKEGLIFTNAFSNGPYTTTSFPSILTSAISLRYWDENLALPRERVTIAEVLKERGYMTAAFHSNPYLTSKFGYSRGFDYFEDFGAEPRGKEENIRGVEGQIHRLMVRLKDKILATLDVHGLNNTTFKEFLDLLSYYYVCLNGYSGAYAKAKTITEKAASWLKKNSDMFTWLHYMDVHGPYIPPREYRNLFYSRRISDYSQAKVLLKRKTPEAVSKEELEILIGLYDAGIYYVDKCIGRLITYLKETEAYDDSLIIITADHGEEFNEHGGFTHKSKLYDELLHVPLIMKAPRSTCHKKISGLCSLIDLGPTILDMLRIPIDPSFEGASLLPMIEGKETGRPYVISACGSIDQETKKKKRISLRTDKWKYILIEGDEDKLYNLLSDPEEKRNQIRICPEKAKSLKSKLIESSHRIHYDTSPSVKVEEQLKMRLKALGYF